MTKWSENCLKCTMLKHTYIVFCLAENVSELFCFLVQTTTSTTGAPSNSITVPSQNVDDVDSNQDEDDPRPAENAAAQTGSKC